MVRLHSILNLGRFLLSAAGVLLAVGILVSTFAQDADPPEVSSGIPVRKADGENANATAPAAKAISMGESIIESVGQTRYEPIGQQKEGVEFIWTPALLIQQVLREEVLITYPNE